MRSKSLVIPVVAAAITIVAPFALSSEQDRTKQQDRTHQQEQVQDQEQVYGSQLMTQEERMEFRKKMRAAKSVEEREQIRQEHHKQMKERAKERGVTIPDTPPMRGGGMGPTGGGMGPASGMGTGSGQRR